MRHPMKLAVLITAAIAQAGRSGDSEQPVFVQEPGTPHPRPITPTIGTFNSAVAGVLDMPVTRNTVSTTGTVQYIGQSRLKFKDPTVQAFQLEN